MTPFPDFKIGEMQNLKSKYFLGILKEFGILVVPEKLRFGLKTWIWALVGNAPYSLGAVEYINLTLTLQMLAIYSYLGVSFLLLLYTPI